MLCVLAFMVMTGNDKKAGRTEDVKRLLHHYWRRKRTRGRMRAGSVKLRQTVRRNRSQVLRRQFWPMFFVAVLAERFGPPYQRMKRWS